MAIVEVRSGLTQSVQLCPGTQNEKSAPMPRRVGSACLSNKADTSTSEVLTAPDNGGCWVSK